ncbi:MAG: conserved hypothetical cytosolic protein [Deltaproteobacteria bacterium]|nr:conserved hypothetical cytosolic protein [Deltaproteobacteria bacterium]
MRYFLGIDDTDVLGHRPGTGRLVRDLGAYLEAQREARLVGVIRHQLLVDPRIPYTSHNSPACLIVEADGEPDEVAQRLFDIAAGYIVTRSAPGSDPGVCLGEAEHIADDVLQFGYRASSEVVAKADALALASRHDLLLVELGGTGDGVIGALAAVGLTAEGNAGRFLELAGGLRGFGEEAPASALRQRGISLLSVSRNGEVVPAEALIATGDWVRPRLIGGRPVLLVEQAGDGWCCFDRKAQHAEPTE